MPFECNSKAISKSLKQCYSGSIGDFSFVFVLWLLHPTQVNYVFH